MERCSCTRLNFTQKFLDYYSLVYPGEGNIFRLQPDTPRKGLRLVTFWASSSSRQNHEIRKCDLEAISECINFFSSKNRTSLACDSCSKTILPLEEVVELIKISFFSSFPYEDSKYYLSTKLTLTF